MNILRVLMITATLLAALAVPATRAAHADLCTACGPHPMHALKALPEGQ